MKKVFFSGLMILALSLVFVPGATAQYKGKKKKFQNRFNAGITMGTNLTQIDGDLYTGFNKIGLRGGLEGSIYLNRRLDIVAGLLFVQKGSKTNDNITFSSEVPPNTKIQLDYMEVPFLLSIKLGNQEHYGYTLEAGISYARLINSKIDSRELPDKVNFTNLVDQLNSNELNAVVGFNFIFSKQVDIGFFYEIQLNKLYEASEIPDNTAPGPPLIKFMRNYLVGIQAGYRFFKS